MKKTITLILSFAMITLLFAGCGSGADKNVFKNTSAITVISREANSGTRGAFDEMMKILVKEGDKTVDKLYPQAIIVDSTDAVASKVEVDKYAIGYTSLGSVNDNIKAVSVDGVKATVENVKNGTYKIARPFVLATKGEGNALVNDFIKYINSKEGQQIVADKGFIKGNDNEIGYTPSNQSGKITLSGSTSVEKVMEKLKEEYIKVNPNVNIEIIYSGSSAGIKDVTDGKVDIGMSSRELKSSETAVLNAHTFALDGIAVIANKENPVTNLESSQITKIFTGEITKWEGFIQ